MRQAPLQKQKCKNEVKRAPKRSINSLSWWRRGRVHHVIHRRRRRRRRRVDVGTLYVQLGHEAFRRADAVPETTLSMFRAKRHNPRGPTSDAKNVSHVFWGISDRLPDAERQEDKLRASCKPINGFILPH